MLSTTMLALLAATTLAATTLAIGTATPADDQPDPSEAEVPLATAHDGWRASLVVDQGETGIWTVESFPVFPEYACPEIVGCDDRGRLLVMVGYSGKWTPLHVIEERAWLGGLTHGDVDPRHDGAELYTGGENGTLHQVLRRGHGQLDDRIVAHWLGREIHTLLAGDLDPRTPGAELLAFTRPGALYRVTPTGEHGGFEDELLEELTGRVRDAVVIDDAPPRPGFGPEIATVSRDGRLELLRIGPNGVEHRLLHSEPMGSGRIALAQRADGRGAVLYQGFDDGRVVRHERRAPERWTSETVYAGPQGVRGVAAGRFHADPEVETVAVFGYCAEVHLLSRRRGEPWKAERLFVDRDKGHWLAAAEVDGRNATDEIVGSGYGGRIFLLARPPGYGVEEAATAPPSAASADERDASSE